MWKDIVQYGNIIRDNIKWLFCNLDTGSLHALSAKTFWLSSCWKNVQTDNDKYDHSFISLLDFLNSLPIFFFLHVQKRKQHVSWRLSYLEMSRFHIYSMSNIIQFFWIWLCFVVLWRIVLFIFIKLIVFNLMSQNNITEIDNHWNAKQMLPRKTSCTCIEHCRAKWQKGKKVSYILLLNLYCD